MNAAEDHDDATRQRERTAVLKECWGLIGDEGVPTIRVTHSLQSMLLMTKMLDECPNLPFDEIRIRLAEPIKKVLGMAALPPDIEGPAELPSVSDLYLLHDPAGVGDDNVGLYAEGTTYLHPDCKHLGTQQAFRLAGNLIRYIESIGGLRDEHRTQVQQSKKGKSGASKKKGAKKPDYLLGREIKLSPQLRALASADGPARYRFRSRWLVRGHFRHQPVGEGRSDRKVLWIQPHWKGPKDGPVLVPRYVADVPTTKDEGAR